MYSCDAGDELLSEMIQPLKRGFFGMSEWSFCTGEMFRMKLFLYLFALLGGYSHNRATANQSRYSSVFLKGK